MYNNIDIIGGAITFFLNFWFELVYLSGKKNVWIEIKNRTLFSKIDKINLNENVDNNFQKSCVLPGDSVVISEGTLKRYSQKYLLNRWSSTSKPKVKIWGTVISHFYLG